MLIGTRWQRELIAALHLEPLFKSAHLDSVTSGDAMNHHSGEREAGHSSQLLALLQRLGVGADVVEGSIHRSDAATARAAANIAEWMTYLPEDCVKAMVNDGWHWST